MKETFILVKQQYTEQQKVIDYWNFVDAVPKKLESRRNSQHSSPVRSEGSETAALGRGEQYPKKKIPILKQEVETRYKAVKEQFESKAYTTETTLQDAIKKLKNIDRNIT